MTQEQMRNLNTIVETYGNDAQEDMAIEECSELIKAILKFRRSDEKTAEMRDAVIDEIADVQIMLTQLGIYQMIEFGKLTKEEGLYLMVNTLADENHRLNQMCNDLIMRMPSRLLVETITGKN